MSKVADALMTKIADKSVLVGVVGLGYVGLPLVREFCDSGIKVIGFDVDERKVKMLNAGKTYIEHLPGKYFQQQIKKGMFRPTANMAELKKPDAILIAVPTPLDKMHQPDMSYVEGTTNAIAKTLRKGQLVVLESTTYPGTTREICLPILEESKLKIDKDFFLAFSPEREDPGRVDYTTKTIPKVVGGVTDISGRLATAVYGLALDTPVHVSKAEVAEACKIVENVYRCVNIALVNELKMLFDRMDINVWEVIEAAKTKPFGFHAFYPGPGLGGHCIPIDPFYLSWKAREYEMPTRFIELAGEINTAMPEYVVERTMFALNDHGKALKNAKVLIIGLAYKPDVDDVRESPSVTLIEKLQSHGAKVDYHDPHIPNAKPMREHNIEHMQSVKLTPATIKKYDCVLISTNHKCIDYDMVCKNAKLVVDTRNATGNRKRNPKKIYRA